MEYRINRETLFNNLSIWDSYLKRKVHLIACGGTALTLLGIKASTKDVDFMVPDVKEYKYLISILEQLNFRPVSGAGWSSSGGGDNLIYDLYSGKKIHTTELLESPLEKPNHLLIREFSRIYLGALNYYDLIISKLFRGTTVDMEDCLALVKNRSKEIDLERLKERFKETASFDISEDRVNKNLEYFLELVKKEGSNER